MKFRLFLFAAFVSSLLGTGTLFSQEKTYRFINFQMEDGLPDNYGLCGFLDSRGMLWIGTEDGLASFDGTEFTTYFHEDSENSLPKNYIVDIVEDKKGYLWISTSGGLARFDPFTNCFQRIKLPFDKEGLFSAGTAKIYIDKEDVFWIASYRGGFFSYDPEGEKITRYTLPGFRQEYARDTNTAHNFLEDPLDSTILWITARNGLYRLDKKTDKITHLIDSKPFDGTEYYTLHEMYFRTPHELWMCSWGKGLVRYNTQTGAYQSYNYDETGLRSNVLDFLFINDSTAWVATQNNGIGFFHTDTKEFEFLPVEPRDRYGMQAKDINTIVPVGNDQLWFVTYGKGISFYDPSNQGFSYVSLPDQPKKRSYDFAFDPATNSIYVASSNSNFLHEYTIEGKLKREIPLKGGAEKLQSTLAIILDHRGELWAAGSNISRYIPGKSEKAAQKFRHPVMDSIAKSRRRGFMDIIEDNERNIWFIGNTGGLFKLNEARNQITSFKQAGEDPHSRFNDLYLRDLYLGKDGKVWVVHEFGLTCYDPDTEAFSFFSDEKWGQGIEPLCLVQSDENTFWVGTQFNGLLKLVRKNGTLSLAERISRNKGLPSELIVSIDIDSKGRLWLGTAKGVVRYHPINGQIHLYNQEEGIPDSYLHGEVKCLNNRLYVSNLWGYCTLDLEEYSDPRPPRLILKEIKVFGETLITDTVPNFKSGIQLDYDQDFFTIEYAGIVFSEPELVEYAYKLEGYDDQWVHKPETGNLAVYTGVKPGEYVFKVNAANAYGVWGQPKRIKITIAPPFWQTWWFYLLTGLCIVGILIYLSHLRTKRVRQKERIKSDFEKQLATMELTALRAQMNPHFIFNCLNSIKHLIVTGNTEEATVYLMNFANLIRLVLDHSAKERISLSEELKMTELYVKMEKLRFDDRFSFSLETDPELDLDLVELPPLILQPFVENAIWHGLMHKEGKAKLSIKVEEDDGMLLCIIDDNGIGREKAGELKSKSVTRKKPYGLKLAGNRLQIYNKLKESKVKIDLKIIDKFDVDNKPEGTTILLKIPLWKLYGAP